MRRLRKFRPRINGSPLRKITDCVRIDSIPPDPDLAITDCRLNFHHVIWSFSIFKAQVAHSLCRLQTVDCRLLIRRKKL